MSEFKLDDERHGTYAGYQQHKRADEPACGPCRRANAAYTKAHRSDPYHHRRTVEGQTATNRALWRLVDAHRDEYERLRVEELTDIRRTR